LTSRGWVDPVPDPLLLRKSGSAGDRTRDLCICSQKLWPLDRRGGRHNTLLLNNLRSEILFYCITSTYTLVNAGSSVKLLEIYLTTSRTFVLHSPLFALPEFAGLLWKSGWRHHPEIFQLAIRKYYVKGKELDAGHSSPSTGDFMNILVSPNTHINRSVF